MSILNFVPNGYQLRPWQESALLDVEKYWGGHDVIVIPGSVGFGKSLVAATIARWCNQTAAIITPRVSLQQQYGDSFASMPILKGRNRYPCHRGYTGCGDAVESEGSYCEDCNYKKAKSEVANAKAAVFNLSSYYFADDLRQVIIVDEAHLTYDFLVDQFTVTLWKHKEKYPDDIKLAGDIGAWLDTRLKKLFKDVEVLRKNKEYKEAKNVQRKITRYARVRRGISEAPANFFIEHCKLEYRGEAKAALRIRPYNIRGLPEILWPPKVTEKIVLMSGTISKVDIRKLGLQGKRIKWIDTINPIPAASRPVVVSEGVNMSYKYQDENIPKLCAKINELAQMHQNNGLVHCTYGMAAKMKPYLKGPRFIWHTSDDREAKLAKFKETSGAILIACGMGEGIDLAGPQFDWQVIAKIMYPNKSDALINKWYGEDQEWINWLTVKSILQQTGRIVRSPDDYGVTYILDSSFGNLKKKRRGLFMWTQEYFPEYYKESIIWQGQPNVTHATNK